MFQTNDKDLSSFKKGDKNTGMDKAEAMMPLHVLTSESNREV